MSRAFPEALAGRFEPLMVLGQGAFGTVYEVKVKADGARRALKLVEIQGDGERELRELTAFWKLKHPRVLACYEGGRIEDRLYLLLELAQGSLADRMGKPGTLDTNWEAVRAATEGVAAFHRGGLIHRDLKPANVMLTATGPKLGDLGLVRVEGMKTLTKTGMILGTPGFLAPEQARGDRATPATDTFALGSMFFLVVEGRLPFPGESAAEVLAATARGERVPFVRAAGVLPGGQLALIEQALDPDPARRPTDLEAFAAALGPLSPSAVRALEDPGSSGAFAARGGESGATVLADSRASAAVGRARGGAGAAEDLQDRREATSFRQAPTAGLAASGVRKAGSPLLAGALGGRGPGVDPRPGAPRSDPSPRRSLVLGAVVAALVAGLGWILSGQPEELDWEPVGDALRVRFSSWRPQAVSLEIDGVRVEVERSTVDGRAQLVYRGLDPGTERSARLVGPRGATDVFPARAEPAAIGPRVALGTPGRLRLEVLRPCQARFAGEEAWSVLSGSERELDLPAGDAPLRRLEWEEDGIRFEREISLAELAGRVIAEVLAAGEGLDLPLEMTSVALRNYSARLGMGREAEASVGLDAVIQAWKRVDGWVPWLIGSPAPPLARLAFFEEYDTFTRGIRSGALKSIEPGLTYVAPPAPGSRHMGPPTWPTGIRVEVPLVAAGPEPLPAGPLVLTGGRRRRGDKHEKVDPESRSEVLIRWPPALPDRAAAAALHFQGAIETYCEVSLGPEGVLEVSRLIDLYETDGLELALDPAAQTRIIKRVTQISLAGPARHQELARAKGATVYLPLDLLPEPGSIQRLEVHSMRGDRVCTAVIGSLAVVYRP